MSSIITNEKQLRLPCEPVRNVREGGEIARKLYAALDRHNKRAVKQYRKSAGKESMLVGVGLAAPQIGIHKRVCVIRVGGTPLVLMNPVIVEHGHARIPYNEGCLSFPGKSVDTWRYIWVKVQSLNHPEVLSLGPTDPSAMSQDSLLTSIVAQHEIAHLFGLLMWDFTREDYPSPQTWGTWRPI